MGQNTLSFHCFLHYHAMIGTCGHNWCLHVDGDVGGGGHGSGVDRGWGVPLHLSCCPLSRQG